MYNLLLDFFVLLFDVVLSNFQVLPRLKESLKVQKAHAWGTLLKQKSFARKEESHPLDTITRTILILPYFLSHFCFEWI